MQLAPDRFEEEFERRGDAAFFAAPLAILVVIFLVWATLEIGVPFWLVAPVAIVAFFVGLIGFRHLLTRPTKQLFVRVFRCLYCRRSFSRVEEICLRPRYGD